MKRRIGGLATALVLAIIGTVALVAYVQSAKDQALAGEQLVDVLVVTEPIAKGVASEDIAAVKTVQVPVKVRAQGSVASLDELKGLVAGANLVPGEQFLAARFVTAEAAAQRVDVPPGLLEVTVSLEPQRAVGGQVRVGDTVAVLASFEPLGEKPETSNLILHKVLVTAVQVEQKPSGAIGGDKSKDKDKDKDADEGAPTLAPTGNLLVTLALDAPSVERVVFAGEHGRVWLSAEPKDAPEGGTKIVTPENVH
jgi:pilus assembly protein CpaB